MRRSAIGAIVGGSIAILGLGGWWLVQAAPWSPVEDGVLKSTIDSYQGYTYDEPPLPQSGLTPTDSLTIQGISGDAITSTAVQQLWEPMKNAGTQGKWQAWGMVVDADTGEVLLSSDANTAHTSASTAKIFAGLVALEQLDPNATLATGASVGLDGTVYLWGQGDLLLGSGVGNSTSISGRAGLADLAASSAQALKNQGLTTVTLNYQDKFFQGDRRLPAWTTQAVTDFAGDVAAFAFDTGRTSSGAWEFVDDSARAVADNFAEQLQSLGITVTEVTAGNSPADGVELGRIESAPIEQQIQFMLQTSDNTMADQFCHLAAAAQGTDTSFAGSSTNAVTELAALGVDTAGINLEDCSGLSLNTKASAQQLVSALQASVSDSAKSHALVRLLARGGMNGTLEGRLNGDLTFGNVQAKTGSLGKASTLSGILTTVSGQTLIFAIGTDEVPDEAAYWTRSYVDDFVTGLSGL